MLQAKDPQGVVLDRTTGAGAGAVRPRILVAGASHTIEAVTDAVGEGGEIVPARSVGEALLCLRDQIDIVVCDVRFDDSRMFDFLQQLKERPPDPPCRVVCVRTFGARLSSNLHKAIAQALEALGVELFVDLHQVALDHGEEAARQTLRRVVLGE